MRTTAEETPSFRLKNRVVHVVYGLGTIVDVNERYTTIAFDGAGIKKFLTAMVELVRSDSPAPARTTRRAKKVAQPPS